MKLYPGGFSKVGELEVRWCKERDGFPLRFLRAFMFCIIDEWEGNIMAGVAITRRRRR